MCLVSDFSIVHKGTYSPSSCRKITLARHDLKLRPALEMESCPSKLGSAAAPQGLPACCEHIEGLLDEARC